MICNGYVLNMLLLFFFSLTNKMASKRPLVIDCDPGNDDATAILMALNDPDVDVKAITCVEGNTDVKQTARNALRTLHIANRLDVSCNTFLRCKL